MLIGNINIWTSDAVILLVVLCGCETWSLTLREECRLRVFDGRVLRRLFVTKRDEIIAGWGKLHSVDLINLCSLQNFIGVGIAQLVQRWVTSWMDQMQECSYLCSVQTLFGACLASKPMGIGGGSGRKA
jgi:hypothetical protein